MLIFVILSFCLAIALGKYWFIGVGIGSVLGIVYLIRITRNSSKTSNVNVNEEDILNNITRSNENDPYYQMLLREREYNLKNNPPTENSQN